MALSGFTLHENVDPYVQKMLQPEKVPQEEKVKFLALRIVDQCIIVDKEKTKLEDELANSPDAFSEIMSLLKEKEGLYVIYDCSYSTKECPCKKDLVLITWTPDNALVKEKMLYASSVEVIKKRYSFRHFWQLSDEAGKDKMDLIEKFGSKGSVTHLEGVPLFKK